MLLVDDLLTAPVKGLFWIFQEIHQAAGEAQAARRDEIMAALSALYIALEQGEIDEDQFDRREQALLDELDALDAAAAEDADEADDAETTDDSTPARTVMDLVPGLQAQAEPSPATAPTGDAKQLAEVEP